MQALLGVQIADRWSWEPVSLHKHLSQFLTGNSLYLPLIVSSENSAEYNLPAQNPQPS